MMLVSNWKL